MLRLSAVVAVSLTALLVAASIGLAQTQEPLAASNESAAETTETITDMQTEITEQTEAVPPLPIRASVALAAAQPAQTGPLQRLWQRTTVNDGAASEAARGTLHDAFRTEN